MVAVGAFVAALAYVLWRMTHARKRRPYRPSRRGMTPYYLPMRRIRGARLDVSEYVPENVRRAGPKKG